MFISYDNSKKRHVFDIGSALHVPAFAKLNHFFGGRSLYFLFLWMAPDSPYKQIKDREKKASKIVKHVNSFTEEFVKEKKITEDLYKNQVFEDAAQEYSALELKNGNKTYQIYDQYCERLDVLLGAENKFLDALRVKNNTRPSSQTANGNKNKKAVEEDSLSDVGMMNALIEIMGKSQPMVEKLRIWIKDIEKEMQKEAETGALSTQYDWLDDEDNVVTNDEDDF